MTNLENKVALITGGSKGIGYGVAEVLLREGMKVVITSRSQKAADKAADGLNKIGKGEVFGVESDVRNFDSQKEAVRKTIDKFGKLDLLFANAGLGHYPLLKISRPNNGTK